MGKQITLRQHCKLRITINYYYYHCDRCYYFHFFFISFLFNIWNLGSNNNIRTQVLTIIERTHINPASAWRFCCYISYHSPSVFKYFICLLYKIWTISAQTLFPSSMGSTITKSPGNHQKDKKSWLLLKWQEKGRLHGIYERMLWIALNVQLVYYICKCTWPVYWSWKRESEYAREVIG